MKKILLLTALLPLFMGSCKDTLETYNDQNRIAFVPRVDPTEVIGFTFLFHLPDAMKDTVWLEVATMGFLSDSDRPVTLRQIESEEGAVMAQPGVHYVAFDNPEMQKYYVVRGGENSARIPVVFLRTASMKETEYSLDMEVVANDYFEQGYLDRVVSHLTVSDIVAKPDEWTNDIMMNLLGDYGPVKYRFMIDVMRANGYDFAPDGPWIASIRGAGDSALEDYWQMFFQNALYEENARRAELELPPLAEADGKVLNFIWRPF